MDFENKLIKWMESVGLVQSGFQVPDCVREFDNISSSDHVKKNIKTYFRQVIESNPGYLRSLKKYFDEDYNLINQINFK